MERVYIVGNFAHDAGSPVLLNLKLPFFYYIQPIGFGFDNRRNGKINKNYGGVCMEKYVQINKLSEAADSEKVCACYPNPQKNRSGFKTDEIMLKAEQDAFNGECKLLVWRSVDCIYSNSEYIKKSDVISMLKKMQIDTAKCNGFIAGMVSQTWVIRDLIGEKIKDLGGTPYVIKDSKLVDMETEA